MSKDYSKVKENLLKLGYEVSEFNTKEAAAEYLNGQLDGTSIGIGGSVTVREMGLFESLSAHNEVWWHWAVPEGMTNPEVLRKEAESDRYICSVNGIAETGEIIEIDGTGNRVASIAYGHSKVYLLVSENKLEDTFEKALLRARNVASPLNSRRLNRATPCAKTENCTCFNCSSPERICNVLMVLWHKPTSCAMEVVLIHENLGY